MDQTLEQRCIYCGAARTRIGTANFVGGRDGVEVEIRGVPAHVCDTCDEVAFDGPLALELSETIEAIIAAIGHYTGARSAARTG
jgi:YgiT-type zinc finger domain-containing protein